MGIWTTLKTIPAILGIVVRAPGWRYSYSRSYKRARKEFKFQLIEEGIPRNEAEALAELYPFKMKDIIETARSFN